MARTLDKITLDGAANFYTARFFENRTGKQDRRWVMGQFYNFTFRDEFDYLVDVVRHQLSGQSLSDFNSMALDHFGPRTDEVFQEVLKQKLAVDPDGGHVPGTIGSTVISGRLLGQHTIEVEAPWSIRRRKKLGIPKNAPGEREVIQKVVKHVWPVYAGEGHERAAGNPFGVADELPGDIPGLPVGALNTTLSNEVAILAADAIVDNLDEGTGAAVLVGVENDQAQPANPDVAKTGTTLFTLVCSDPAFGAAADGTPGGVATASAITADASADATGTLAWLRASSTNDGATPLDDHIDGEAGTSGADHNFNTLSIVAGSNVDMDGGWTVTVPES